MSPKATFLVIDPSTIAFANMRSEGTVENLRHEPRVEVDLIDPFKRLGCRVRGSARYTPLGNLEPATGNQFRRKWPDLYDLIRGIVTVGVSHARIVISPSYDVGADADQLSEQWRSIRLCPWLHRHNGTRFGILEPDQTGGAD